ncbi:uncharacterized protein LOC141898409 [Tubulanus polymorphus]|uniref:uncharacterized protein LOC141898409 n=1 Tax=Tubulanus polymorphus TaxID=672921 RepID=UPI003DA1CCBB
MQRYDLHFQQQEGMITTIVAHEGELSHILNIKRGILSTLQLPQDIISKPDPAAFKQSTVYGVCEIKSRRELRDDATIITTITALTSCNYDSEIQIKNEHSNNSCQYTFNTEDQKLKSVICNSIVSGSSLNSGVAGINIQTRQEIHLQVVVPYSNAYLNRDLTNRVITNIQYQETDTENRENIDLLLEKLLTSSQDQISENTVEILHQLVTEFTKLSKEELWRYLQEKWPCTACTKRKKTERQNYLIDALVSCQTVDCNHAYLNVVFNRYITGSRVDFFLYDLAFRRKISKQIVLKSFEVCKMRDTRACWLSLGTLISKYHNTINSQTLDADLLNVVNYQASVLGLNCYHSTVNHEERVKKEQRTLIALKSIGNMGIAAQYSTSAVNKLMKCSRNDHVPLNVSVAALQAMRKMVLPQSDLSQLLEMVVDYKLHYHSRIESYLILMKQTERKYIKPILSMLKLEKSSQVRAFITSHLNNILSSNTNPRLKELIESCMKQDDVYLPEIDWSGRRLSHNIHWTKSIKLPIFHSEVSGSIDADILYDPASFIPRSTSLNITIDKEGRRLNVAQLGVNLLGWESTLNSILDRFPELRQLLHTFGFPLKTRQNFASKIDPNFSNLRNEIVDNLVEIDEDVSREVKADITCYIRIMGEEIMYGQLNDLNWLKEKIENLRGDGNIFKKILNLRSLVQKLENGADYSFSKATKHLHHSGIFISPLGIPINWRHTIYGIMAINANFQANGVNPILSIPRGLFGSANLKTSGILSGISEMLISIRDLHVSGAKRLSKAQLAFDFKSNFQMELKNWKLEILNPKHSQDILNIGTTLQLINNGQAVSVNQLQQPSTHCTPQSAYHIFGMKFCSLFSFTSKPHNIADLMKSPSSMNVQFIPEKSIESYQFLAKYEKESGGLWKKNKNGLQNFDIKFSTPGSVLQRNVNLFVTWSSTKKDYEIRLNIPEYKQLMIFSKFHTNSDQKTYGHSFVTNVYASNNKLFEFVYKRKKLHPPSNLHPLAERLLTFPVDVTLNMSLLDTKLSLKGSSLHQIGMSVDTRLDISYYCPHVNSFMYSLHPRPTEAASTGHISKGYIQIILQNPRQPNRQPDSHHAALFIVYPGQNIRVSGDVIRNGVEFDINWLQRNHQQNMLVRGSKNKATDNDTFQITYTALIRRPTWQWLFNATRNSSETHVDLDFSVVYTRKTQTSARKRRSLPAIKSNFRRMRRYLKSQVAKGANRLRQFGQSVVSNVEGFFLGHNSHAHIRQFGERISSEINNTQTTNRITSTVEQDSIMENQELTPVDDNSWEVGLTFSFRNNTLKLKRRNQRLALTYTWDLMFTYPYGGYYHYYKSNGQYVNDTKAHSLRNSHALHLSISSSHLETELHLDSDIINKNNDVLAMYNMTINNINKKKRLRWYAFVDLQRNPRKINFIHFLDSALYRSNVNVEVSMNPDSSMQFKVTGDGFSPIEFLNFNYRDSGNLHRNLWTKQAHFKHPYLTTNRTLYLDHEYEQIILDIVKLKGFGHDMKLVKDWTPERSHTKLSIPGLDTVIHYKVDKSRPMYRNCTVFHSNQEDKNKKMDASWQVAMVSSGDVQVNLTFTPSGWNGLKAIKRVAFNVFLDSSKAGWKSIAHFFEFRRTNVDNLPPVEFAHHVANRILKSFTTDQMFVTSYFFHAVNTIFNIIKTNVNTSGLVHKLIGIITLKKHLLSWQIKESMKNSANTDNTVYSIAIQQPFEWDDFDKMPRLTISQKFLLNHVISTLRKLSQSGVEVVENYKPDPYTALIFGTGHVYTFDGLLYEHQGYLSDDCAYLLARDFIDRNFTILSTKLTITVLTPDIAVTIDEKNHVLINNTDSYSDLPIKSWNENVQVTVNRHQVTVDTIYGYSIMCDSHNFLCAVNISGWYQNHTLGLLGTNDNEITTDFRKRDGRTTWNIPEFLNSYEITGLPECRYHDDYNRSAPTWKNCDRQIAVMCQKLLQDEDSPFARCFDKVDPTSFKKSCDITSKSCEFDRVEPHVCNIYSAYVTACSYKGVRIQLPLTCSKCVGEHAVGDKWPVNIKKAADVVFVIDEYSNYNRTRDISSIVNSLVIQIQQQLESATYSRINWGLVSYGSSESGSTWSHVHTLNGKYFGNQRELESAVSRIRRDSRLPGDGIVALLKTADYPFREHSSRSVILITEAERRVRHVLANPLEAKSALVNNSIMLTVIAPYPELHGAKTIGVNFNKAIISNSKRASGKHTAYLRRFPKGDYAKTAQGTEGAVFNINKLQGRGRRQTYNSIGGQIYNQLTPQISWCRVCECYQDQSGAGFHRCRWAKCDQ